MSVKRVNSLGHSMREEVEFLNDDLDEAIGYADCLNNQQRAVLSKVSELVKDLDRHLLILIRATSI